MSEIECSWENKRNLTHFTRMCIICKWKENLFPFDYLGI